MQDRLPSGRHAADADRDPSILDELAVMPDDLVEEEKLNPCRAVGFKGHAEAFLEGHARRTMRFYEGR